MAVAKNPDLVALPDSMKNALKMLHDRFGMDWDTVVVTRGRLAIMNMDHQDKVKLSAYAQDKLLRAGSGGEVRGSGAVIPVVVAPALPSCLYCVDDYVIITKNPARGKFHVKEVLKKPFGRTGFWCLLKYAGTDIKYEKGAVESAELEACEAPGVEN